MGRSRLDERSPLYVKGEGLDVPVRDALCIGGNPAVFSCESDDSALDGGHDTIAGALRETR